MWCVAWSWSPTASGWGPRRARSVLPAEGKGPPGWVPAQTCIHTVGPEDAGERRTRGAGGVTRAEGLLPTSFPSASKKVLSVYSRELSDSVPHPASQRQVCQLHSLPGSFSHHPSWPHPALSGPGPESWRAEAPIPAACHTPALWHLGLLGLAGVTGRLGGLLSDISPGSLIAHRRVRDGGRSLGCGLLKDTGGFTGRGHCLPEQALGDS